MSTRTTTEAAATGGLEDGLRRIGEALDEFLRFEHPDPLWPGLDWKLRLERELPLEGAGLGAVLHDLVTHVIPAGSAIPKPGFTGFITTGGTTASTLASTAASIASPQRYGLSAFNFLEELSLDWLAQMFGIDGMKGVYSSGGSTANLLALGAARQWAFEKVGRDAGADGVAGPVAVFATAEAHHTVQRAAGVLGLGRRAVKIVANDANGRMDPNDLRRVLRSETRAGTLPIAVVATAGTTNTGAIDPIQDLLEVARELGVWLHLDGAYGLPGILDDRKAHLYAGHDEADSVIVDPHKWLGASAGVAATFVRDRSLLERSFTQTPADYLEGTIDHDASQGPAVEHSMDDFGIPYFDYGVELTAPPRGVIVWAMLREIGVEGMRDRVRRHNDMAARIADQARSHPNLELLLEPTLSICCFRYVSQGVADLDTLNRRIHRRLVRENRNLPSTTRVDGKLAIRPCFIGARTTRSDADSLVEDVLRIGEGVVGEMVAGAP